MIALVTDRWAPRGGGRERYLAQLVRYLEARGEEVTVLCRDARPAEGAPSVGATLRTFPGPAALAEPRLAAALRKLDADRAVRTILAARPQREATHVQLHSGLLRDTFAAERASMRSALRRALYVPALRLNSRRLRFLREEAALLAGSSGARLMAFSSATALRLRDVWRVDPERITVAPPGVDLGVFSTRPAIPSPPLDLPRPFFLFAGHNFPLKGLGPALEAIARLERNGRPATLLVAGRGAEGPWVRLAATLGLRPPPRFLGDVDQETLAALYRAAAALVHPAFYDPYPRVVPEALACGCPVITTSSCGAAELVEEGRNGFVVTGPREVGALAGAMRALLDDGTRARMGAAAVSSAHGLGLDEHFAVVAAWLGLDGST